MNRNMIAKMTKQAWNDNVPAEPFSAFGLGYTYTAGK
jgi:hypothetical protein